MKLIAACAKAVLFLGNQVPVLGSWSDVAQCPWCPRSNRSSI